MIMARNESMPRFHFEGQRKAPDGKPIYVLMEIKSGEIVEVAESTFKKYQQQQLIEY